MRRRTKNLIASAALAAAGGALAQPAAAPGAGFPNRPVKIIVAFPAGGGTDYLFKRDVGGLAPLGGTADMASYKGYGFGMMAHILGGALSGSSFSPIRIRTQKPEDPDNLGHFFMAIDPAAFRDEGEFEDDLDAAIDVLHAVPPADPALPVLVPGDPEAIERGKRLRDGIPMPVALIEKLREVCMRCGALFLLDTK